jgi:hypothetical protein
MRSDDPPIRSWTKVDSHAFMELMDIFAPVQQERIRVLTSLIPAGPDESVAAVELDFNIKKSQRRENDCS